jgi:signal transduction histidine kinase
VAQEFNNQLVAITGAVEMLSPLLAGNKEAGNYLAMIERNGERAVELTRQLLAYARQGKYSPRVVSLNRAVLENVPILKAALPSSVELRLDLARELPPVLADITQLKQAVMSLCLNSGEAMPDGGILTIRTWKEEGPSAGREGVPPADGEAAAGRVRSGKAISGPRSVLEVSDTGCGMEEKTLARIFEPFFSTKFIGRGMGLAAVRASWKGTKGRSSSVRAGQGHLLRHRASHRFRDARRGRSRGSSVAKRCGDDPRRRR